MNVTIGEAGLKYSWQKVFPKTTECCKCGGESRIGFVAHESAIEGDVGPFVYELHENDPEGNGYWLHDSCTVAIYFCRKCLESTSISNQA